MTRIPGHCPQIGRANWRKVRPACLGPRMTNQKDFHIFVTRGQMPARLPPDPLRAV